MQDQVKGRLDILQREITFRENEIAKTKKQIGDKSEEAAIAHVAVTNQKEKANLQHMEMISKDNQIRKLTDEVVKLKHQIDTVVMTRMSEGTAQM